MNHAHAPGALLAVAFPPSQGLRGASTTIADLGSPRYGFTRFMVRRHALWLIVRQNMDRAIAHGHGNKAARREAQLILAAMPSAAPLSPRDVDVLAELYSESRTLPPARQNYHD